MTSPDWSNTAVLVSTGMNSVIVLQLDVTPAFFSPAPPITAIAPLGANATTVTLANPAATDVADEYHEILAPVLKLGATSGLRHGKLSDLRRNRVNPSAPADENRSSPNASRAIPRVASISDCAVPSVGEPGFAQPRRGRP